MRISAEQLTQIGLLVQAAAGLFPKRRKLRRLGELVAQAQAMQGPYQDARRKIDEAADAQKGCLLTVEEVAALDAVMDAAGKLGSKVRRALPS